MLQQLLAVLFVVWLAASTYADPPPRFTFDTAAARSTGALVALDADGTLHVEDAGKRQAHKHWIELRQDGRRLPPLLTRNFVSLSNGDRLPLNKAAFAKLEETRLQVWPAPAYAPADAKPLNLFAPNVVLLFWSLPDGIDEPERFFAELQDGVRKRDVVFLKNGDRIEGTISALNDKAGCVIVNDGRKVQTPWSRLAGIAFNTDRQARLKTKKAYARAVLEDGARLNLLDLTFDEKSRRWLGKTQFGANLDLPESAVLALDVRQGPAVDLSDLAFARYGHKAFLGAPWPLVKDAAATGEPLRLAGDTFEKGLGMHAAAQVAYKLDGKFERFDAVVGIDERSRLGRAKVAIDLDGKRIDLNEGKELTIDTPPIAVRLDVKNVRMLTLIVDFGSKADVQANVSWAKARLVKKVAL